MVGGSRLRPLFVPLGIRPPPTDRLGRQVNYIANESTITAPTSNLKYLNYLKNYKYNKPET